MKLQTGGSLTRLYGTLLGATAISLLVLFALSTVARVEFEASGVSSQKGLNWFFISQPDLNTFSEDGPSLSEPTHSAWEAKGEPNSHPRTEAPKNASFVGIQPNPVSEPAAVAQNTSTPVSESVEESRHRASVASTLVEESDVSTEWDAAWGDGSLVEDSEALLEEEESLEDTEPVDEADTRPIEWKHDVCLLVKIGRRGGYRPNVPFGELYRLFNAAKGAPNGSEAWVTLRERRLFVGTDFADILCLMVRDDLGPHVECTNYNRFGVKTNQVTIHIRL